LRSSFFPYSDAYQIETASGMRKMLGGAWFCPSGIDGLFAIAVI